VSSIELADGRGGEGGEGGAKSYDGKKARGLYKSFNIFRPTPVFFVVECTVHIEEAGGVEVIHVFLTSRSGFIPLYVQ
jgi:hypothetical protein